MTVIFRDGKKANFLKGSDLVLINRDKETIVNMMEDFDFEERLAIIQEIMNADPIQGNVQYLKIKGEEAKSFFGFPIFDNINSYKSKRYKVHINTAVSYSKKREESESD